MAMYIIGDQHNRVKIGVTRSGDPIRRFQVGNADKLVCIRWFEDCGFAEESFLHRELYEFQIREGVGCEWFVNGRSIVKAIDAFYHGIDESINVHKIHPHTVPQKIIESSLGWEDLCDGCDV